ncbi:MAG: energy-coupling factor ABC transporter permease [Nitrosomonadales bacterium]|nr:energy-coupling factor ABC transporter permease [Nitrosomonadales bacterium]
MNLPAALFESDVLWLGNLIFIVVLVRALKFAQWRELLANNIRFNALVGLLLGITLFWQLNAGIRPGFNFHLVGATLFVLMFGWPVALIALTLVMSGTWIYKGMDPAALGINGVMMLTVPILFSEWLLRFSQRKLPKNFFVFVLWNGFFCAAVAIAMMMAATTLLLLGLSHYTWVEIQYHYFIPAPILIFAESFATGAVITGFTVAQPEAVMHFSEKDYLTGK